MIIEENKVYNCDCIELMQEMVKQGVKADCLLTDIPYDGVNRDSNGLRNLNKENADKKTFQIKQFMELADMCVSGVFLIFCGDNQVSEITSFFREKGYSTRLLIWEKNN